MMQHRMHMFYSKAKQYCSFVKDWIIDEHSADELSDLLMELYQYAKRLPVGKTAGIDGAGQAIQNAQDISPNAKAIQVSPSLPYLYHFTEPFGPEAQREIIQQSLKADLGDICDDLLPGISLYESGEQAKACCLWRSSWEIHWGTHSVNALRVLHAWQTQTEYLKGLMEDLP